MGPRGSCGTPCVTTSLKSERRQPPSLRSSYVRTGDPGDDREAVWAVPQAIVKMSPEATYIHEAFTAPSYRRRGLLFACLKAIREGV
jgi:hypothetical protein